MFNKIIIIGNLTRDVELRYFPSGGAIATIGLASNRRYTKQDGSKGDETCFVDVKLFGRTAEVANQYLHKGSKILIEGRLGFESWNDQSGQKRSKHVIIAESMQMLDSKSQSSESSQNYASQNSNQTYGNYDNSGYNQAPSNDYPQNPNYTTHKQPSGNAHSQENIPSYDVDDEIPF
ncbi:single-stranded DNA-binding protein [Helicobacter fennelliae]|uniref:Single-stranded DNA-binding protein n=2 Tax=Helicobacter fennelliae TaxID=215 RepID=T1DW14_9HELI|nr:single-stranded DNA-binding protein [Helicobacter fennelliae]GAD19223.1 single-stranded DNA-binding protein [Helicobacter fennelliae MRY12-0050]SQB99010.1 single-stranded DNA-binding protein [Helicobacter fennelliae]STP08291.1 single-stranded DNA-binding protein [Helicobacter fennelliae]STQ84704.1 single-stranded DNA-binding protein [Helicobacter fennelliae]